MDIKSRYYTKAAEYYRQMLDSECNNKVFTKTLPTVDQARKSIMGQI